MGSFRSVVSNLKSTVAHICHLFQNKLNSCLMRANDFVTAKLKHYLVHTSNFVTAP